MNKEKIARLALIGGGIMILMVILKILNVFFSTITYIVKNFGSYYFWKNLPGGTTITTHQIAFSICLLAAGIMIIISERFKNFPLPLVGFGLLSFHALIDFIKAVFNIFNVFKRVTSGAMAVISFLFSSVGSILLALFALLAFLSAVGIIATNVYQQYEDKREKILRFWFAPAAFMLPSVLIGIINLIKGIFTFIKAIFNGTASYAFNYALISPVKSLIMLILLTAALYASMSYLTGRKLDLKKIK